MMPDAKAKIQEVTKKMSADSKLKAVITGFADGGAGNLAYQRSRVVWMELKKGVDSARLTPREDSGSGPKGAGVVVSLSAK